LHDSRKAIMARLAHAADIACDRLSSRCAGEGMPHHLEQLAGALQASVSLCRVLADRLGDLWPMVKTGRRRVAGSWKIMRDPPARRSPAPRADVDTSSPPCGSAPARAMLVAQDRAQVTSCRAVQMQRLAALDVELTHSRMHGAVGRDERHMEVADLAEVADRIGVMYAGKIVELAPVEQMVDAPQHPTVVVCLRRQCTTHARQRLEAIPGAPPDLAEVPTGCSFAARCKFVRPDCTTGRPTSGPPATLTW